MATSRITITIPGQLVEAADRAAAELDRSRSWVLVEALKAYLAGGVGRALARESPVGYVAGLGPGRRAQLEADLALEPVERVRLSEDTARVAELRATATALHRVIGFERIEDFHRWERLEGLDV